MAKTTYGKLKEDEVRVRIHATQRTSRRNAIALAESLGFVNSEVRGIQFKNGRDFIVTYNSNADPDAPMFWKSYGVKVEMIEANPPFKDRQDENLTWKELVYSRAFPERTKIKEKHLKFIPIQIEEGNKKA